MLKSVISDKVVIADSHIDGKGMFAKERIAKGEIVFIKGGHILKREQLFSSGKINSYLPIDDEYFIAAETSEEEAAIKLFNNHSCDPNCGLRGEITFVAIHDIEKGEELTVDYAFIDDADYEFDCTCGFPNCRKKVRGRDWKIPELKSRYREYFAAYLQAKFPKR
ncbi:MAG: SET domain-containing protein-lysine N-methyltransferase [Treponema sp.]|jgi:SET domain-containing protein|nr:SET domain-containing protein-lysine N-methyltransferase [Treponema sp.]